MPSADFPTPVADQAVTATDFMDTLPERDCDPCDPHTRLRDALWALSGHTWPGNVRELEHTIERAAVLCAGESITQELLGLPVPTRAAETTASAALQPTPEARPDEVVLPLGLTLDEVERRYVEATLRACGQNQSQAARALHVGRNTLRRKAPRRS